MEQMISKDSKSRLSAAGFMSKYRGKLINNHCLKYNQVNKFSPLVNCNSLPDIDVSFLNRSNISRTVLHFPEELHEQVCHASCSHRR